MQKVVVMGVSGSGKSTLAAELARALACPLIEGDDHHLPSSRDKMSHGIALQDADREPWLDALAGLMAASENSVVLACSALKRRYRERLQARVPGLAVVYIEIDPALALERVASRSGHFFPASVVTSQFDDLEPPLGDSDVLIVAATLALPEQRDAVLRWLERRSTVHRA